MPRAHNWLWPLSSNAYVQGKVAAPPVGTEVSRGGLDSIHTMHRQERSFMTYTVAKTGLRMKPRTQTSPVPR